jgi:hypothetical protein
MAMKGPYLFSALLSLGLGLACGSAFTTAPADGGGKPPGQRDGAAVQPDSGDATRPSMDATGDSTEDTSPSEDGISSVDGSPLDASGDGNGTGDAMSGGGGDASRADSGGAEDSGRAGSDAGTMTDAGGQCLAKGQCDATHPCPLTGSGRVMCCPSLVRGGCGFCTTGSICPL